MPLTLRQLSGRQRDALRVALATMLERHFAYPSYFDYRRNARTHRPVDGARRLDIIRHIQQTPLEVDVPLELEPMERWIAQTLLSFANSNPALAAQRSSSQRHILVRRARRAAADIAQYALSGLLSDAPAPFPVEQRQSWLGAPETRSQPEALSQHERQTQMIALVLARPRPPAQPATERQIHDQAQPASPRTESPGLFGFGRRKAPAQPIPEPFLPARPREASADLLQLYGEYLNDMQPELTTRETAAIPRPSSVHSGVPAPGTSDAQTDTQLFYQLRFQIESYVRKAARGYGLPNLPGDPAYVIEALRGSNLVDESDLRMAEGILALTDRVIGDGRANLQDYRQALMLYLLYHRSHLA